MSKVKWLGQREVSVDNTKIAPPAAIIPTAPVRPSTRTSAASTFRTVATPSAEETNWPLIVGVTIGLGVLGYVLIKGAKEIGLRGNPFTRHGEVIPSRRWVHKNGAKASIYGAVPWTGAAGNREEDWHIETVGWTIQWDDGTVGIGRQPFGTQEGAQRWLDDYMAKRRGAKLGDNPAPSKNLYWRDGQAGDRITLEGKPGSQHYVSTAPGGERRTLYWDGNEAEQAQRYLNMRVKQDAARPPRTPIRLYLERVKLDRGGYDRRGKYWGVGQPLYRASDDSGKIDEYVRANDRAHAKDLIRRRLSLFDVRFTR